MTSGTGYDRNGNHITWWVGTLLVVRELQAEAVHHRRRAVLDMTGMPTTLPGGRLIRSGMVSTDALVKIAGTTTIRVRLNIG